MLDVLATDAPGVNPLQLLATGATEVRATFPGDQLNGILSAYMSGIKGAFAVGIGRVGLAFVEGGGAAQEEDYYALLLMKNISLGYS
ncbi:hypothetical protein MRS44_017301 [Fusarium solani]|uniref:uncharacterized protein n=1 Tax=Fusarium solani TaxID=169388 RepID=UPI0032C49CF0|nr:hypothetical protein MRS44_017301 [Fusarium solani]